MDGQTKKSILLVEDEIIIALAQKKNLEQFGYEVIHESTGESAVKTALESDIAFNLILMDIDLGSGIDGIEAAETILRQRDIPVLFLSSHSEPEIVEKAERITSYGYVLKNSSPVVIDASIKMALKLFKEKIDRAKVEVQLRISEEKLFATMQSIGDAVITCDVGGMVVSLNPVAERLTGWKQSNAIGKPVLEVFHIVNAETRKEAENPIFRALREGAVIGLANHTVLLSKDGREYQIADSCAPIRKNQEQILGAVLVFRDVTDEYKQKEELHRAQLIIQNLPIGLYLYHLEDVADDRTLRLVYANPIVKELTGVGSDAIVGKTLDENFPKLRDMGIPQRYAEVVRTQQPQKFDDVVYGDNRVILASFSVIAFPLPGNHVGIAFDNITERKRVEGKLSESLTQYEAIFESSGTAMVLVDEKDTIFAANSECAMLTGYSKHELIGSRWQCYVAPESLEIMQKYHSIRLVDPDAVPGKYETKLVSKTGVIHDVILSVGLIPQTKHSVVTMVDITESKQAEKSLIENEERINLLIELAPDAFLHGDERGNLIGANLKAIEMFGYSKEELLTMNIQNLFPPEELAAKPLRYDMLSNGAIIKIERKIRKKSGDLLDIEMNSRKMPDGTYQSFIRDMTDIKLAEEELRRQLEEKEILLREVHHRIKNNMASVAGLLSLQASSTSNEEAQTLLLESVRRVESIQDLYDKLLHGTDYRELSIKSYIEDLLDLVMDVYVKNKKITIKTSIDDFLIDSKRAVSVGIIINEVLTNTFKYAFANRNAGSVLIELQKVGEEVSIIVQDDGIGMQVDKTPDMSSGLGLYLVRMLVEQLRGTYDISSDRGLKTVIKFIV